jgi:hypothetical protein
MCSLCDTLFHQLILLHFEHETSCSKHHEEGNLLLIVLCIALWRSSGSLLRQLNLYY